MIKLTSHIIKLWEKIEPTLKKRKINEWESIWFYLWEIDQRNNLYYYDVWLSNIKCTDMTCT